MWNRNGVMDADFGVTRSADFFRALAVRLALNLDRDCRPLAVISLSETRRPGKFCPLVGMVLHPPRRPTTVVVQMAAAGLGMNREDRSLNARELLPSVRQ